MKESLMPHIGVGDNLVEINDCGMRIQCSAVFIVSVFALQFCVIVVSSKLLNLISQVAYSIAVEAGFTIDTDYSPILEFE